jgi:hypothetical protein
LEHIETTNETFDINEEAAIIFVVSVRNLSFESSCPSGVIILPGSTVVVTVPWVSNMEEFVDNFTASVFKSVGSLDSISVTAWKSKLGSTVGIYTDQPLVL